MAQLNIEHGNKRTISSELKCSMAEMRHERMRKIKRDAQRPKQRSNYFWSYLQTSEWIANSEQTLDKITWLLLFIHISLCTVWSSLFLPCECWALNAGLCYCCWCCYLGNYVPFQDIQRFIVGHSVHSFDLILNFSLDLIY